MSKLSKTPLERVAEAKASIEEITVADLAQLDSDSHKIIDVREEKELQSGSIADSIHIPRGMLEFEIMKHCEEKGCHTDLILYCKTGGRSALSAEALKDLGFSNIKSLEGGYDAWAKHID